MQLMSGTKLFHREIIESIGAGGVGEVYLAEITAKHEMVPPSFHWSSSSTSPETRPGHAPFEPSSNIE